MKKGLFLSIMLFAVFVFGNCVPALAIFADHDAFVIAKAVKLGRGNAYSVVANSEINTAQNELKKGECEENSDCSGNKITSALIIVITSLVLRGIRQKKIPTAAAVFLCVPIIAQFVLPQEAVLSAKAGII